MDSHYAARLLRFARKDPDCLIREKKYWKPEFFPFYLRRCDDLLWENPGEGLVFSQPAPDLAAKIAASDPTANGADYMILGYSYLGGAYRRNGDYSLSEVQFQQAKGYRDNASPKALAEYLRRYAYLCLVQHRPEAFGVINEAIAIHKRGNLVSRHPLGECLLCRGAAYLEFEQPDKVFDDYTAALNHLSFDEDPKPYYCALHNLATWAVDYGTDAELEQAMRNLKPARRLLNCYPHRRYAQLTLRWLCALIDVRLGNHGRAEVELRKLGSAFQRLGLAYEIGMVQLDLARIYLAQDKRRKLQDLANDTAKLFRRLGNEACAEKALDIWRELFTRPLTETGLREARDRFHRHKQPIPSGVAA